MLMKGEKLACGFAILVSSECPHLHTFTLLMPVDLKQLRLGGVFIVSREWVHGVLSCLYLVPTYPTPSLSNSFRFPLPVAQLRKAAPCHFLSSCATLILQFSFFSYIFLSSLLYFFRIYFLLSTCLDLCRNYIHTPYFRSVFMENFSSGTQQWIWNPDSRICAQASMCIFHYMIFLSDFYVSVVRPIFFIFSRKVW